MRFRTCLILIMMTLVSCIEEFIPEVEGYTDLLYIEGRLTDDPELPPRVLITRAVPLGDEHEISQSVSGAVVFIISDDGTEYPFYEKLYGEYVPVDNLFTGETGRSYKLLVNYRGERFESDYEELLPATPVDEISASHKQKKRSEAGEVVQGLQFYVTTQENPSGPSYFRWILDATYVYEVPYLASHVYDGQGPVPVYGWDFKRCYITYDIPGVYISSTEGFLENRIIEEPLNFVDQYGDELSSGYSLHAWQFTINQKVYQFWSDMDRLINQTGGLYESQPFRLEGNVWCTTDPSTNVTGIFEVAGVSERREFFPRPQGFKIVQLKCELDTVGTLDNPWDKLPVGSYLFFQEDYPVSYYYSSRPECFDCQTRGGVTEKPAFWEFQSER